jgi:hypothetical protein
LKRSKNFSPKALKTLRKLPIYGEVRLKDES